MKEHQTFRHRQPSIIERMSDIKRDDIVIATITKRGYWIDSYVGTVVGFTKNGVKVKSWRGIKTHSIENVCKRNK